ncbi:MAG: hypothetical protein GY870_04650 [archaeon]|nr:hypothetical protein [archaeon]
MIKKTRQDMANVSAERWKIAYYKKRRWYPYDDIDFSRKKIYESLLALGKNPKPDEVDKIIGNSSWTMLTCNECNLDCEKIISVGESIDYDFVFICGDCLRKALNKIKEK